VEYGKQLANQILDELDEDKRVKVKHDDSTAELIRRLLK
jgi:glucose-6-phosphate isomerase